jgi:predicted dehydrogenase
MTNNEPIPVAVIGVGHLGSRHARVYASLPQARLVGVADVLPERARRVADEYRTAAVSDYRPLLPRIRAASVVVPTVNHYEIVLELLEAGVDVLVEKPIAATVAEAEGMVETARAHGGVLAVGHTERYNPAVKVLLEQASDPRFIEVHRLGVFTPRSLDIDAVLDLMIHDLDVVATLVRSEVRSIEAIGVPVLTEKVDIANARLRFASGCVANLTASRISQTKVRKLRVWEPQQYVSVDYLNQQTLSYRLVRTGEKGPEIQCEDAAIEREEPLKLELADFLGAVVARRPPRVSGADGLRALELATQIISVMEQ